MARRRESFLQQTWQGQANRSHVMALMYKARALGLGPGKAATLVGRFLVRNQVNMPSLQADFWDLWDLAGVQARKSGSKTRVAAEVATDRQVAQLRQTRPRAAALCAQRTRRERL